jgi:sec-independent protein translocase protein TatA
MRTILSVTPEIADGGQSARPAAPKHRLKDSDCGAHSAERTAMIGDLFDSPWKILIVAVVLIVLFGSTKLPGAARSLGKSMRILKTEMKSLHEDGIESGAATPDLAGPQQVPAALPGDRHGETG